MTLGRDCWPANRSRERHWVGALEFVPRSGALCMEQPSAGSRLTLKRGFGRSDATFLALITTHGAHQSFHGLVGDYVYF
jgi:hypothetical protein